MQKWFGNGVCTEEYRYADTLAFRIVCKIRYEILRDALSQILDIDLCIQWERGIEFLYPESPLGGPPNEFHATDSSSPIASRKKRA